MHEWKPDPVGRTIETVDDDIVTLDQAIVMERMLMEINRLRSAGDALAAAVDKLDGFITGDKAVASEVEQTLLAWQEARRG
jgi:hypothetical protein